MKILLTMNLPYIRADGGANKSNRCLAEELAARQHSLCVVVPALATPSNISHEQFLEGLAKEGIDFTVTETVTIFTLQGVEIHGVRESSHLRSYLEGKIEEFKPDWLFVSAEDTSQNLLSVALKCCPDRVVYLAHTIQMLPFGPESFYPGRERTELIGQASVIVTIGNFVAEYINKWSGFKTFVNHPPHFGKELFPNYGYFNKGYVLMVNPCTFKGLPIFMALAQKFPDVQFAVLLGWGTTSQDINAIREQPNITILPNSNNIDDFFAKTRILVMPSLWVESFGMSTVEAMVRGIPVLASNLGGLVEAKLGVDYSLPVRPIEQFTEELDERMLRIPILPEQDIRPWEEALNNLLTNRTLYEKISQESRQAALKFVSSLSVAPLEEFLLNLPKKIPLNHGSQEREHSQTSNSNSTLPGKSTEIANLTPEKQALLLKRLMEKRKGKKTNLETQASIPKIQSRKNIPLSFAQQRLWFLDQLEGGSATYNMSGAIKLTGVLKVIALENALREIVRRHEVLRTSFQIVNGSPVQVIDPQVSLTLPLIDLQTWVEKEQITEIQRLAKEDAQKPFNLSHSPLLRVTLLKLAENSHILLVNMHHIVSDGWSISILIRELSTLYQAFCLGKPSPLPELSIQYVDFADWQREWLKGENLNNQLNYWKAQLGGISPLLELPSDRPRPSVQTFRGGDIPIAIEAKVTEKLKTLSLQSGATLFMILLAAFAILLSRYSGQDDIVIGSPIANRNRSEIEHLIGFFANTLVLRTDLSGNPSFRELLARVRERTIGAYAHQDLPFEKLVEELQPQRDLSYNPIFQIMFVLQSATSGDLEMPGLTISDLKIDRDRTHFDLSLDLWEEREGLQGFFAYSTDLFNQSTIVSMVEHFQTILAGIVANPDQRLSELPLLTKAEEEWLLVQRNVNQIEYPQFQGIHQLFEARVAKIPGTVGVIFEETALSYQELNCQANQLAHYLQKMGVQGETLVGIYLERSWEMALGVLGILKAGGAYLPLDPAYPQERLAFMLKDTQVSIIVTQSHLDRELLGEELKNTKLIYLDQDWSSIAQESGDNLGSDTKADNLAYVIYTSGSTGNPKGVMITHDNFCHYVQAMGQRLNIKTGDRYLHTAALAFSSSARQLMLPLSQGATVVITNGEQRRNPLDTFRAIKRHQVTVIDIIPSYWRNCLNVLESLTLAEREELLDNQLRLIVSASEPLSSDIPKIWRDELGQKTELINMFGQTETTGIVATYPIPRQEGEGVKIVSIGKPLPNTQFYVLDKYQNQVPIGVPGELYIGGKDIGRGYLNRDDLTQQIFIANPFSQDGESRLYKTGDLVRYLPDGNLEYLGRADFQVKIRGFRIELGEIETVLIQHSQVQEAVVIVKEDKLGNKRLVAYFVARFLPERLPYQASCKLMVNGHTYTLKTEDFSLGGVKITGVSEIFALKDSVNLVLPLPGENGNLEVDAEVVWVQGFQAGIRWQLSLSDQERVHQSFQWLQTNQDILKILQRTFTQSIREYLKQKLPDYMIPNTFVLLEKMPLTSSGKIDRRSLPVTEQSILVSAHDCAPPRDLLELQLVQIWSEILQIEEVGIYDSFFEIGGHSLLAVQLMTKIQQQFQKNLPLASLFQNPTVEHLARLLRQQTDSLSWSSLVNIQPHGTKLPFFWVHPIGGNILCYFELARHLGTEQPFYAFQSVGLDGKSEPLICVEDMASHYIHVMRSVQPQGPYLLAGWSFGGLVALEMAQQLQSQGHQVLFLGLIDTDIPSLGIEPKVLDNDVTIVMNYFGESLAISEAELQQLPPESQLTYILEQAKEVNLLPADFTLEQVHHFLKVYKANFKAIQNYKPQAYFGRIDLFRPYEQSKAIVNVAQPQTALSPTLGWSTIITENLHTHWTPGNHTTMILPPHVEQLVTQLRLILEEVSS